MSTNLEEMRNLLLSLQAQLDNDAKASPDAPADDRLPEVADQLADGLIHPLALRDVLLHLAGRITEINDQVAELVQAQAAPVDAPAPADLINTGGE